MSLLHAEIRKAVQILEKVRYQIGIPEFVHLFIDHWAFQQSGLFAPSRKMPEELEPVAFELSHLLSHTMKKHPADDVLGMFFCECGYYKQGLNFFPTPPDLSRLTAALINSHTEYQDTSFYEPCAGTGSMSMKWVIERLETGGKEFLERCELVLEDIDRTMCKAALI